MQRLTNAINYVPAGVFFGFAAYYLFQMLLGIAPSNPLSWELYLSISPLFNEASAVMAKFDSVTAAVLLVGLGASGLAAAIDKGWSRFRFVHFHAALLIVFAGMTDERVFSASIHGGPLPYNVFGIGLPDFSRTEPAYVLVFLVLLFACLQVHRSFIWNMSHPRRRVSPVSL